MKKQIVKIAVGALVLFSMALTTSAIDPGSLKFPKLNKVKIPNIEQVTLENGMRLYLLEDHSLPLFHATARINCGSYLEPAGLIGLADMTAAVMRTGGTSKWTGDEIDQLLENVGGMVETSMDQAVAGAHIQLLSDYTDLGLEVLAEVLRRPVFDQDKIDLAMVQTRSGISRRNDDITPVARREWLKLVYGPDSPFARHIEYATLEAITRDGMIAFHSACYRPENIQLAVWGDFDKKIMIETITKLFGDWKKGEHPIPPLPPVKFAAKPGVYYAPKADSKQSFIRVGHIGGYFTDDDYATRLVINSVLNGAFGSRITDNVRTKMGLAYSAAGNIIDHYSYPGYIFSYASTKPQSTVLATSEIIKQFRSMVTDAPTDKEMIKGKDGYLNSFVFNFDTKAEVIQRLMTYDFYDIPDDFLDKEKQGVESATSESVLAAAQQFLKPEELVILIVGNGAEFDAPLESLGLGPVDTIDITIPPPPDKSDLEITPENIAQGTALLDAATLTAGGLSALQAVTSIQTKTDLVISMQGNQIPGVSEETFEFPDRYKSVMKVMGLVIPTVKNGDTGWNMNPRTGEIQDLPADDLADVVKERNRYPVWFLGHRDDIGYKPVFETTEELGGHAISWIALVDDTDEVQFRVGVDADNNLRCVKYWGKSMMGEGTLIKIYDDFQKQDGIMMAKKSSLSMDGQLLVEETISDLIINGEISEEIYTKP